MPGSVAPDLSDLPVVDGHCHPLLADPWALAPAAFTDLFTEGRSGTMGAHVAQTGYFRRALRELARRLDTEPTVEAVLAQRRHLGPAAAAQWIAQSRIAALLVDTGYPPGAMVLGEMRRQLPCAIHEVFRIEACAQDLLAEALPYRDFVDAFVQALRAAVARSVAFKSIIAYRSGLAIRPWAEADATAAYEQARIRFQRQGTSRLTDKPLLDTLFGLTLDVARETDRPLQVHAGFGDPDIDLGQANPLLLRPLLEDPRRSGVRIVILHMAYPYFREAAFMAAVWPDIHLDLSLALPFLGAGAVAPLIEILALAPASKVLYGSDVQALPELFAMAADWGRFALGGALTWLAERDELTGDESREIARQILAENAVRLYGLPSNATSAALTGAVRSPREPRRGPARSPSTRRRGV
jgi:uncharacterized protein